MSDIKEQWDRLEQTQISCRKCPRLVDWREEVARVKRRAYLDWNYWGKPVPGFALDDCLEIIGDEITRTVSWKRGNDVSSLAGQAIRLRFALKDADVYSLQFVAEM